MGVSAADRALWEEIVDEKTPLPAVPAGDDDVITFAEQEIDRTCRAGEDSWFISDARPLRDFDQPTDGFTLPRLQAQRSSDPMWITPVERAAASAALGCPPWELGLCTGCSQMMRRYGQNAAMYCNVCRAVLNGR